MPELPEPVHWDGGLEQQVGAPAAFDHDPERVAWLGRLKTDWMGDDAFLQWLYVEVRRQSLVGGLARCRVTVTGKEMAGGHPRLNRDLWMANQRGELQAKGHTTVMLPARSSLPSAE